MNLKALLNRKIAAIGARLKELDIDFGDPFTRTARLQELATERGNLRAELRHANRELSKTSDLDRRIARREQEERAAEAEIAVRTEAAKNFIERLDAQSDFRQSRIWREHLLQIPSQVYAERRLI